MPHVKMVPKRAAATPLPRTIPICNHETAAVDAIAARGIAGRTKTTILTTAILASSTVVPHSWKYCSAIGADRQVKSTTATGASSRDSMKGDAMSPRVRSPKTHAT
jgi:hypothetical protein